jgi:hypothetical protein
MYVYRFSVPAYATIEVVAADEASARALLESATSAEVYPETDLEEGDLDGAGRVTLSCVTVEGAAIRL